MCVYVCLPVCVEGFVRMRVGVWLSVFVCARVLVWGAGRVCVYACVSLVRICAWFGVLHILTPPHTQAHAHTQKQTDNRTCTPLPHTHTHMPLVE